MRRQHGIKKGRLNSRSWMGLLDICQFVSLPLPPHLLPFWRWWMLSYHNGGFPFSFTPRGLTIITKEPRYYLSSFPFPLLSFPIPALVPVHASTVWYNLPRGNLSFFFSPLLPFCLSLHVAGTRNVEAFLKKACHRILLKSGLDAIAVLFENALTLPAFEHVLCDKQETKYMWNGKRKKTRSQPIVWRRSSYPSRYGL